MRATVDIPDPVCRRHKSCAVKEDCPAKELVLHGVKQVLKERRRKYRRRVRRFKLAALQRLEAGASVAEVARAFEVNPNVLHRWRREFRQGPGNAFPGLGKRRWEEGRVAQLERKIGQQTLEIDFLNGCLQRIVIALTGHGRVLFTLLNSFPIKPR